MPRRAEYQVSRQIVLIGKVGSDSGGQARGGEDRHARGGARWLRRQPDRLKTASRNLAAAAIRIGADGAERVVVIADPAPQPVREAMGVEGSTALQLQGDVMHWLVDQVVLAPHIVAAHDGRAPVDRDDLRVVPGE